MRRSVWNVLLGLLFFAGCSGEREPVLAEGSGVTVTAGEFATRYEAFLSSGGKRDNIVARKQILGNMVNEKRIFMDLARLGKDNDPRVVHELVQIRDQAMLDAYSRRISTDTMTIADSELYREFTRRNSKVNARYVYAHSREEALVLKRRLENGETFESIAKEVFSDPGLANNGGSLGYFSGGEMEPMLEDTAFSLPIGALSEPVKIQAGYAIIRVDDRVANPLPSESDFIKVRADLERSVSDKKAFYLLKNAAENIEKELSPVFQEETLRLALEQWQYVAGNLSVQSETHEMQSDFSGRELVRFRTGSWTASDFMQKAKASSERQRTRVRSIQDLKDFILGLAMREVLIARAQNAGLSDDSLMNAQINLNSQAYKLKYWRSLVQDTVGQHGWPDAELKTRFNINPMQYQFPTEVNVAEILVRTKPEAERLLRSAKTGTDFAGLARVNSIRLWAARRGGELGFGTKASFGIMGEKFFAAKKGTLLGPEFVDPYWAVFKILDRREGRQKSFDEAKPSLIDELSFLAKQDVFSKAVQSLQSLFPVELHLDALAKVSVDQPR